MLIFTERRDIDPDAIRQLRGQVGWREDEPDAWQRTLDTALCVAACEQAGKLIGIGFVVGSERHAVLCDLCVHPDHRRQGIADQLITSLLDQAATARGRYLTLTWNEQRPWLVGLYRRHGFEPSANAMQHPSPS